MFSILEKSILETLVYFNLFSKPLKKEEIFDALSLIDGNIKKITENSKEFKIALENLISGNFIEKKQDLFFLKGRNILINERKLRERISNRNWNKLEKIARKINYVPFVEGVFISGSLSINNSNYKSDIDLFVVTRPGRIFTVRFFLTMLLDILGKRRKPGKVAGKICLNHYISKDCLNMKFQSLYSAYIYFNLRPVIDRGGIFKEFREKNSWIGKYILFWDKKFKAPFCLEKKSKLAKFLEKILSGSFGDLLEKKTKEKQIKRKKKNYPNGIVKGRVILNNNLIELHPNSEERNILENYKNELCLFFAGKYK